MNPTRKPTARAQGRRTVGVVVAGVLALSACSDPVGADSSGVTAEDLERIRDEVATLEDRVATLEDRLLDSPGDPVDELEPPDPEDMFFGDPRSSVGQRVIVRGEVVERLASTDVASAFRIAGVVGDPVAVVSVTPPPDVTRGDVVEVSGAAVEVDPGTFEAEFGIAADALFDDPDAWFAESEGQVAIAAVRIEVQAPDGD